MIYWQLFISFIKIGLLGFGGGMAIISLTQHEIEAHGWMSQQEFVDIVAISQVTPGPVGINCATYVGYTATQSVWGSLLASFAIVLPSLIIMLIVCKIYDMISDKWHDNKVFQLVMRLIRLAVVLLIAHAVYTLMTPASFIDYKSWIIFAVVLLCSLTQELKRNKVTDWLSHPILLIILSGMAGYALYA